MDLRATRSWTRLMLIAAWIAPAVFGPSALADTTGKVDNRILVTGDAGFGFTTHSTTCYTQRGKLIFFQTPDQLSDEPPHPEVTGWLTGGVWYFDLHTPDTRYFHSDNAGGVVPKQEPHTWTVKLHAVLLEERITMHPGHAYVSGVITCTSVAEMPTPG